MEVTMIIIMVALSIILPTLDTFTDINFVYKLYHGARHNDGSWKNHPTMATGMLTPYLLNYIFCLINFFRKEKNKKFTFIFALLIIYPQFGMNNH